MSADQIKFGTDGWRGVIAEDFTFENVRLAARAISAYVIKNEDPKRGIVVGWDTRFGSKRFAQAAAEEVAEAGIPVLIANDYTPTPAISYAAKALNTSGGIMITSSHNPWMWNGVKFKAKYGGSAAPGIIKAVEEELKAGAHPIGKRAEITETDFKPKYIDAITRFADLDIIEKAKFRFCIDVMYGAGRNILSGIFAERSIDHIQIRSEVNPLFPGINPEPIEPHVRACQESTVREKCHAGFVVDGDADRIGAVDENGNFVDAHKCYAVLLKWLLEYKKWPGVITRAFNTTSMLDRMAKKYGRELIEHGIGFKYVCDIVMSGREVLVGGEESGGIGIPRFLPERDGTLNALLMANAMAEQRKPLGQLVADLQKEFGAHYYGRRDLHISDEIKQPAIRRADSGAIKRIGRYNVTHKSNLDGVKMFLDAPTNGNGAEAWVLWRASGTEPLMRVYCEAAQPEVVQEILAASEALVMERGTAE